MANAACPQRPQDPRLRVALDRVKHVARKAGGEELGGGGDAARTQTMQRFGRPLCGHRSIDRRQKAADRIKAAAERRHRKLGQ